MEVPRVSLVAPLGSATYIRQGHEGGWSVVETRKLAKTYQDIGDTSSRIPGSKVTPALQGSISAHQSLINAGHPETTIVDLTWDLLNVFFFSTEKLQLTNNGLREPPNCGFVAWPSMR